jgi:soluble lytic murein transglycosylase-like protein
LLGLLLLASPASAELAFFTSGRTMSVKGHRVEGPMIVLELRGGGEIRCDRNMIARIEPDEVPYPEPEPVVAEALPAAAVIEGPYAEMIDSLAAQEGVDPRLVHAVVQVESAYLPDARSPKGAMGLMQLMPATARQYSVADAYEPQANLRAGIRHLRTLLDRFELSLALAAYNAGEAAVRRFNGVPPYRETQAYVARILRLMVPTAAH